MQPPPVSPPVLNRNAGTASSMDSVSDKISHTRSTTAYNRAFTQHLREHGILDSSECSNNCLPANYEEIKQMLRKRRDSFSSESFSETRFIEFQEHSNAVDSELMFFSGVLPIIEGAGRVPKSHSMNDLFSNLSPLTRGKICNAKPDQYYGAVPEDVKAKIREDLKHHIIPCTATRKPRPIAPNFFLEGKGLSGDYNICKNQLMHDLALGARGQQSLRSYQEPNPVFDNNAYTLGATYSHDTLRIFSCHSVPPSSDEESPGYVIKLLRGFFLPDSLETCIDGITAYRNARDWAKKQRDESISQANAKLDQDSATEPEQTLTSCLQAGPNAKASPLEETASEKQAAVRKRPLDDGESLGRRIKRNGVPPDS